MKAKNIGAGILMTLGTLSACNNPEGEKHLQKVDTTKAWIADTLQQNSTQIVEDDHDANDIIEGNVEELYTIDMNRVRKGPLGTMKGLSHGLGTLLGGKYADSIIAKYNAEILDTFSKKNGKFQRTSYDELLRKDIYEIKAPLVYPTLKSFFSESLDDFLRENPSIKEQVGEDKEVIIVTRNEELKKKKDGEQDTVRKNVIGYYVDGKLQAAQYMSAGVGRNLREYDHRIKGHRWVHAYTKTGVFHTNMLIERGHYGDGRDSDYASGTFGAGKKSGNIGAPMPYAVPINDEDTSNSGVFLHTGYADGEPRSHECNRLPGWFAMYMYDHIGDRKVKTVIYDMYDKITPKPKGTPTTKKKSKKKSS